MNFFKKNWRVITACVLVFGGAFLAMQSLRRHQVRNAYTVWWSDLRAQNYQKLYQTLPEERRRSLSEEAFTKRYELFFEKRYAPEKIKKIKIYWDEAQIFFEPDQTFGEFLTMKKGHAGWWLVDMNGFWTTTPFE